MRSRVSNGFPLSATPNGLHPSTRRPASVSEMWLSGRHNGIYVAGTQVPALGTEVEQAVVDLQGKPELVDLISSGSSCHFCKNGNPKLQTSNPNHQFSTIWEGQVEAVEGILLVG